jgi:hypothetical protein
MKSVSARFAYAFLSIYGVYLYPYTEIIGVDLDRAKNFF